MLSAFRLRSAERALQAGKLAVAPPELENDEEQKYRPIEWSLVRRMLNMLRPYRKQYVIGISIGRYFCSSSFSSSGGATASLPA
jgi:hypothetical protein